MARALAPGPSRRPTRTGPAGGRGALRSCTAWRAPAAWLVLVACLALAACAGEPPEVPAGPDGTVDAVLVLGRDVYSAQCSRCHGSSGGGGTGPKLSGGEAVAKYPDIADEIAVVADGRNAMPSFAGGLSEAELEAVVRYTREVLN